MAVAKRSGMPSMSRNKDLAGQTVSKNGFNITYDNQGYAVSASNYKHPSNQGTDRGVAAPSADAVLSGGRRGTSAGSSYDRNYMSDRDLASLAEYGAAWNAASKAGDQAAMDAAHRNAEAIRSKYGYSGGTDGSDYIQLGYKQFNPDAGGSYSGGGSSGVGFGGSFSYGDAPSYINRYQSQIDDLTAQILGREAFSYDPETDPAYQQYRESYTRGGERAMQDTLAQMAARTGGLASSYANSVSQQTYDNYMSALADKIPELRQLAYSMYQDEGNNLRNNLSMLASLEQGDYAKFADQLAQYNTDRSFNYGAYRDVLGDQRYDTEWNYQVGRDQLSDQRYNDETAWTRSQYTSETEYNRALEKAQLLASIGDFSGYKALGYSDQEISNLTNAYNAAQLLAQQSSRRSGGGSVSYPTERGSGEADYDGLFAAAQASGHPKSFIANNYKKYGFTSSTGLYDDFEVWDEQIGEGEQQNISFSDRSKALSYMRENGVPDSNASSAMTKSEWERRKASYQMHGQGGTAVKDYNSYSDYLTAYVQYCIETFGG